MAVNIGKEVAALRRMTVTELRQRHVELFGEDNRSRHKEYLVKRIVWRMQALAEGDLSERAKQRAAALANDAALRTTAPREPATSAPDLCRTKTVRCGDFDTRLPMPGSVISRDYKGRTILVRVLPTGFEYEGETFDTLSAIAKAITGAHWNGYHFFGLANKEKSA